MTTAKLKEILIHKIEEIDDVSFLNAIKTILESKQKTDIYILSEEQKSEIIKAKQEVENGNYYKHSEIISKLKNRDLF